MALDRDREIEDFNDVCVSLQRIHAVKSETYGDSWKKRGELTSVFGNVARKFDRIENMARDPETWIKAINGETNEMVEETVLDLAVYGVLWCVFLFQERPENFKRALSAALGEGTSHGKEASEEARKEARDS